VNISLFNLFRVKLLLAGMTSLWVAHNALADGMLFYRFGSDGRVWLLLTKNKRGDWDIPGWRPARGERFEQAAAREATEELCLPFDGVKALARDMRGGKFDIRMAASYGKFLVAAQHAHRLTSHYVLSKYPAQRLKLRDRKGAPLGFEDFDPANARHRAKMSQGFRRRQSVCKGYQYREMVDLVWIPASDLRPGGHYTIRHCAQGAVAQAVGFLG